ncbi:hypothetical protein PRVXT_002704 [Proteinivorax tanatarense]|uniref:Uncharacterized protein n=1 Tax=Proteinivorax tanatarense TaxID=1260629 RepID=A0AAU7VL31_9FIRM
MKLNKNIIALTLCLLMTVSSSVATFSAGFADEQITPQGILPEKEDK